MPTTGKSVPKGPASKASCSQVSHSPVRRPQRVPKAYEQTKTEADPFLRPLGRSALRAKPLYKSSSCHDIKSSRSNSNSSVGSRDSSKESRPKKTNAVRKPSSTVALPAAVLRESNNSSLYMTTSSSVSGDRIYINSDLLSRVEKEKKQYESRISELTQLTESRKTEIERLNIEVKNLKEAKERAEFLIQRHSLKRKAGDDINANMDSFCSSCQRPLFEESSLSTTVVPATSTTPDQQSVASGVSGTPVTAIVEQSTFKKPTVTSLEDIIHEMEEVNYSTTEELEATMNELREMQRTLDGTQVENRTLASDRAILLESLCTQTAKLEHSRLQIDQLKHLLITNPSADSREAHYLELFNSIESEKQILLTQNNDLAQRCESLDVECRQLTEKMEAMSAEMEQLKADVTAVLYPSVMYLKGELSVEDLNSKIECLTRHVALWQERYETELAEHEHEVTEFKLYERDLLKAVQVSDSIRHESEGQVAQYKMKLHELKNQVERTSAELDTAIREKCLLQDQLSKVMDTSTKSTQSIPSSPVLLPCSSSVEKRSVGVMTLPIEKNSTETSYIPPQTSSAQPVITTTQIPQVVSTPPSSAATTFHLPRTYMQKLGLSTSVSPGGPVSNNSSTGIRRAGPTVQSLIQSIENQVKAVQHQQKTKTSPSPTKSAKMADGDATSPLLPQRRLHSAGSSPITTPVRNISKSVRHPLIDESIVGQSAPGGPPHNPTSPPSGVAVPNTQSTNPPAPLTRSTPNFGVTRDDTSSPSKELTVPHVASSTTPRLKRNLTIPTNSVINKPTDSNVVTANATIAEAVTTVISAAAGDPSVVPPQSPSGDSSSPTKSNPAACPPPVDLLDPLQELAKRTGAASKRNALLKWCQLRLVRYRAVDVTNFSSSWNDGLALCALLHTYVPQLVAVNWEKVANGMDKKKRFEVAFRVAESQGIPTTLDLNEMLTNDRPDWASVMSYIASIYKHFEVSNPSS
nr:cytospin a [Hymenolepis microstoma]